MDTFTFGKKILAQCLALSLILSSCTPTGSRVATPAATDGQITTSGSGNGDNATEGDNSVGNGTTAPPTVEIRHLIEPNLSTDTTYNTGTGQPAFAGGGYVRKLTIPKNFAGRMYLAGINIASLRSSFVKVRFRFGVGRQALVSDIPATIVKAPGITPSTAISVLVLDLRSQPFRNIRLSYDLFDYNEYDFAAGDEPVQNNRDSGLYCRGLRIEDDPTFDGIDGCNQDGEQCLYAYAKVADQGLIKESGSVLVPLTPSLPQYKSVNGTNYFLDYPYQTIRKPLADTIPLLVAGGHDLANIEISQASGTFGSTTAKFENGINLWGAADVGGSNYYYRGPYRLINSLDWQFKIADLDGPGRLFREDAYVNYPNFLTNPLPDDSSVPPVLNKIYYQSYLFPLATKLKFGAGVTYLGSGSVLGTRGQILHTGGETQWMDGSNARAWARDSELNHIGSCNVSSSIEVIAQDSKGTDYIVAKSIDVKLQLVRPIQHSTTVGDDVLFNNFKTCTNSSTCSGSGCCLNNRCWDESLVSQCAEESGGSGNRIVGDTCSTDYQCTSLCCNKTSGTCAPHNTLLTTPVLCNKQTGDACIAKEFCVQTPITKCLIIKTGTTPAGKTTCTQYCYAEKKYGDCKNGVCVPPEQPTIPVFDPIAANACDNAVTAPSFD